MAQEMEPTLERHVQAINAGKVDLSKQEPPRYADDAPSLEAVKAEARQDMQPMVDGYKDIAGYARMGDAMRAKRGRREDAVNFQKTRELLGETPERMAKLKKEIQAGVWDTISKEASRKRWSATLRPKRKKRREKPATAVRAEKVRKQQDSLIQMLDHKSLNPDQEEGPLPAYFKKLVEYALEPEERERAAVRAAAQKPPVPGRLRRAWNWLLEH